MDLQLTGKTVVVTGSTSGIGQAIAQTLVNEGATVVINGRDADRTKEAANAIQGSGKAVPVHGDVGSAEGVADFLERLKDVGDVDILVNNAGIFQPMPFFEISDAEWSRFFEINVMSGIRLSRALAPGMQERGWGRIIFISSESGISIPDEMVHYGMTKTAQLSVMRGLAKTLRGTGVNVNAVLPGPTWTEGVADFVAQIAEDEGISAEEMRKQFIPRFRPDSMIERFIEPTEIAAMVAYAVSPVSSATTGAALRVEGGLVDDLG
ncbi:SDR family oxidoreductase [Gimesia sp.]|uniref:SDR family NAD(P)-dependent oxidoreductase n=1 Tax=Gimesia sp. TaxID=2024833 RepID=UPI000C5D02B5|nr:SDR family oxidoreductase [Gimesia sp.]MAX35263.1 oxidoreductase [Gimesia sp.]HAH45844.1 oxidoreductase [Planctomycetaceae bacterium]HBL42170.1 oxidoreductase [Planctomycetaceae bacterium]